jgi:hypothetical protein
MNEFREPVIYTIEGTTFEVDIDKQVLRQTDDTNNEISFINQMQDQREHYLLLYDTDTKRPTLEYADRDRIRLIKVPQLIELDPEGMSEKYKIPVEQLKDKSDFEVIVDQEALNLRHKGMLPKIDLVGEPFVVDVRLHELRHAENFHLAISLKSFELTDGGRHYEAFYHTVLKQPITTIDLQLTEFPDNVVKLRLPDEQVLDPVITARDYGIDEREFLRHYPIQKNLKAEVIPLSETNIPTLIRQNREKLQKEHEANVKKIKPRHRQHF